MVLTICAYNSKCYKFLFVKFDDVLILIILQFLGIYFCNILKLDDS